MGSYDLLIRNGIVVTEAGVGMADVAVVDGAIVEVEPELVGTGREEIDATGLHVFPGVIDAHVHFNEPGRTDWEGWASGTRAVAAGGGTCVFEMPLNAHPPTLDAASFEAKRAAAEAQAVTDFALWGGLVPGNRDHLPELAESGAIGFKAFMSQSGTDDFPAADDLTLVEGMATAAELGKIVAVHAESDSLTSRLAARAVAEGRTSVRDYLASRPVLAEVEAIGRAILFAEETGCALHVVHVSSGAGVALIAAARTRGVDVSCETCPHYLVFSEEDVERLGAVAKCAPPIRSAAEREALWSSLLAGDISIVASDHSPSPPYLKEGADFFRIWGGISGCQSTLSAMLSEGHHARGVPLSVVAAVTAGAVARRFALPRKGRISVGADADLALVDLAGSFVLAADELLYRHPQSPYAGRKFSGRVVRTVVRGSTVFLNGRATPTASGKLVRPGSHDPSAAGFARHDLVQAHRCPPI
ncbi:MAG: allantoinase [Thermomicrobiales bacterium]|nr:allantoinase [Thermomicrobiales bacterium]